MLNKLILFLIRVKLGLKKNQRFRFSNQKTKNVYYINDVAVVKLKFIQTNNYGEAIFRALPSNVSINWLLHNDCRIEKVSTKSITKYNKNYTLTSI